MERNQVQKRMVSAADLAVIFGVHISTIWRWKRRIPGFPQPVDFGAKLVLWDINDVDEWIEQKKEAANA